MSTELKDQSVECVYEVWIIFQSLDSFYVGTIYFWAYGCSCLSPKPLLCKVQVCVKLGQFADTHMCTCRGTNLVRASKDDSLVLKVIQF